MDKLEAALPTLDRAAPARRRPERRRFRHRPLVAAAPVQPAGEQPQDRPRLRRTSCSADQAKRPCCARSSCSAPRSANRSSARASRTRSRWTSCARMGCHAGQGFHFARALPADRVHRLLDRLLAKGEVAPVPGRARRRGAALSRDPRLNGAVRSSSTDAASRGARGAAPRMAASALGRVPDPCQVESRVASTRRSRQRAVARADEPPAGSRLGQLEPSRCLDRRRWDRRRRALGAERDAQGRAIRVRRRVRGRVRRLDGRSRHALPDGGHGRQPPGLGRSRLRAVSVRHRRLRRPPEARRPRRVAQGPRHRDRPGRLVRGSAASPTSCAARRSRCSASSSCSASTAPSSSRPERTASG